jgi:hypothetical protein
LLPGFSNALRLLLLSKPLNVLKVKETFCYPPVAGADPRWLRLPGFNYSTYEVAV